MLKDLNQDFQELINCLTARRVEFMIVGAHALAFHGVARYTEDLDLWAKRSSENADRLRLALGDFGMPISPEEASGFLRDRKFLRFGNPPRKVEILNFLDGCEFETAASRADHEILGETNVAILGLTDYVATKRASDRAKDRSDLALLESMIGKLPEAD